MHDMQTLDCTFRRHFSAVTAEISILVTGSALASAGAGLIRYRGRAGGIFAISLTQLATKENRMFHLKQKLIEAMLARAGVMPAVQEEDGHAYAYGGGGLLAIVLIVLLIILIF